jgi:dihydroorotate dehydrogenase electron transfer subunit
MQVRTGAIAQTYVPWSGVTGFTICVAGMEHVQPGQYFLCSSSAMPWRALPDVCVPTTQDSSSSSVDILIPDGEAAVRWQILARASLPLTVTGPLGKAFTLDNRVRRALLVDYGSPSAPLLLLARRLVERGVEAVYLAGKSPDVQALPPSALPPEIEYHAEGVQGDGNRDLLRNVDKLALWADAAYFTGPRLQLLDLAALLRRRLLQLRRGFAQVVAQPGLLPCGVGACGLCALETRAGTRRLCRDGLVFDLLDLA